MTTSPQPESPEPLKVPEELLAIQQAMEAGPTPGPWIIATSNSWRRIVTAHRMESVCEPITQNDGHPDLYFRNGGPDGPDARLIAACNSTAMAAVLGYIAKLQAARNEAEAMRADAERLDHLQTRGATVEVLPAGLSYKFRIGGLHAAVGHNIRNAIDAAMKGGR